MALAALSGDEQLVIFVQLCNVLDPGVAVAFSSASSELWTLTQAPRQQLQADHEAAAALGRKAGERSCKELREAEMIIWRQKGLSSDDLALLGTLGSVLPALEELRLNVPAAGPDGVQRLAEKLGAGALPAVTLLIGAIGSERESCHECQHRAHLRHTRAARRSRSAFSTDANSHR